MEYRIEEGDPLLRLRCSIGLIPNLNTGVYIIVQQIKQSINLYIYIYRPIYIIHQMGVTKNIRRKGKRCKVQVHDRG